SLFCCLIMANDISLFFTRLFNKVLNPEPKNKRFENHQAFISLNQAKKEFLKSKKKLFSINQWSNLKEFDSDFKLYHKSGRLSTEAEPKIGDFIKITITGLKNPNWVQITGKESFPEFAQFTFHPSRAP